MPHTMPRPAVVFPHRGTTITIWMHRLLNMVHPLTDHDRATGLLLAGSCALSASADLGMSTGVAALFGNIGSGVAFTVAAGLVASRLRRTAVQADRSSTEALAARPPRLRWPSASAGQGDDSLAMLHLLEAERVAKQAVSRNATARTLLSTLLARERKSATPGLRALAAKAGIIQ